MERNPSDTVTVELTREQATLVHGVLFGQERTAGTSDARDEYAAVRRQVRAELEGGRDD